MGELIYLGNTIVGEILDKIYMSRRIVEKHFYVKGGGYPISNSILKELKEKGVTIIRIVEVGKKFIRVYETTLEKYQKAVLIQEPNFDQQRCVPLSEMVMTKEIPRGEYDEKLSGF